MKIECKKMIGTSMRHVPFSETLSLSEEVLYGDKPFQSPVSIQGEIWNENGMTRLSGNIQTVYLAKCARCLREIPVPLSADVSVTLTEDESAEETDEIFIARDGCVQTEDVFLPALYFEISMTYLCAEDCKGLCPHCGTNRNLASCDCDQKQRDPRFAALYALLDQKDDEQK